jgi:phage minor structural protein
MLADTTNGLGRLDPISCYVDEERNGLYDLTMEVSVDDPHYKDIAFNSVIKVKAGHTAGMQMFRVYEMTKPISGIVTVYAHHITYDLAKRPVLPFSATGASATCAGLKSHIASTTSFNITTDITNTSSVFTLEEPKYFRECLGGWRGSFLDTFGGEIEWDNLTVKIHAHRGSDKGYHVRYGKNLVDLRQEESIANVFTSAMGYVTIDGATVTSNVRYVPNPESPVRTKIVDFSDEYEELPTREDLNAKVDEYLQSHPINVPKVNIELSFVSLFDTEEYKDIAPLEYVDMGDTIHVDFERLGVSASAEVITTRWDVLRERLEKIEIGEAHTDLATSITEGIEQTTTEQVGFLDQYINGLTRVITNSLGLFSTKVTGVDGSTKYYLHNRPTLAQSQYQWTINAGGFAVSQDYGQTWSAGIDAQGNAVFNSLSANIVRALEIYGSLVAGSIITFGTGTGQVTAENSTWHDWYTDQDVNGILFHGQGVFGIQSSKIDARTTDDITFLTESSSTTNIELRAKRPNSYSARIGVDTLGDVMLSVSDPNADHSNYLSMSAVGGIGTFQADQELGINSYGILRMMSSGRMDIKSPSYVVVNSETWAYLGNYVANAGTYFAAGEDDDRVYIRTKGEGHYCKWATVNGVKCLVEDS